ncbi:class I SAM-dependent methyltransferase [Paraburkholderia strydomiana]|uniref:O-methyltransferase YrrM n=1 Tax=Paraburkholderia caledonica TaxID=134536 RepID=A0ABU1KUI5_9BURK|nr:class I SAM-dependent methyltransferase [Paraburkholderia caledonica]MDR6374613.1 putative O-methyltransferase YrrM [Paraburkholderia caledonica]
MSVSTELLTSLAAQYPEVADLIAERDKYREQLAVNVPHFSNLGDVPAGHYYSPIPSLPDIKKDEARIFGQFARTLPAIDFNEQAQVRLMEKFADEYYGDMPFQPHKQEGLRYYFENVMFSYGDATSLHCMIRHLKPRRIVEIGSGFSSAVSLDTNDLFFDGQIKCTFVEPNNERLLSLLTEKDKVTSRIVKSLAQEVDLSVFAELEENDILFVDSSHVCKIDSDVNRIVFEILPMLAPGVCVHFHDVFLPFEYPAQWVYEGRAWNEAYLLRAFLQYNSAFEVMLMNTFMGHFHSEFLNKRMPLFMRNPGASFWIRKTR